MSKNQRNKKNGQNNFLIKESKMGIKALLKFLRDRQDGIVHTIQLRELAGYRIAIDLPIICYQKKSEAITKLAKKLDLVYEEVDYNYAAFYMYKEVIHKAKVILEAGCVPVFVFDGVAPALKSGTKEDRSRKSNKKRDRIANLRRILKGLLGENGQEYGKDGKHNKKHDNNADGNQISENKEPFKLTEDDINFLQELQGRGPKKRPIATIDDLKKILYSEVIQWVMISPNDYAVLGAIFTSIGIPHVFAESEAEQTCAQMCCRKDVIAVYTTDSDSLAYGCPIMINKITQGAGIRVKAPTTADCYTFTNVREVLGMTHQQVADFCIMLGTDFNKNCPNYGPVANYKLMKYFGSIKNMIQWQEFLKSQPLADYRIMKEEERLCMNFDFSVLNYDEVIKIFTRTVTYQKESLEIKITAPQFEQGLRLVKHMLGDHHYKNLEDSLRKVNELLLKVAPEVKHEKVASQN
jgi:5'-3' exonuclease